MRVSFFATGEEEEEVMVEEEEEEVVPLEYLGYDVAPYRFYLFKSYPPSLRFLSSSSSSSSSPSCSAAALTAATTASCGSRLSRSGSRHASIADR